MKKLIALCLMTAMVVMTLGPALSMADPCPGGVCTDLTRDSSGAGSPPVVKVKWEMKGHYTELTPTTEGKDDSSAAGAQLDPPLVWGSEMKYSICAIVTDPDSLRNADIAGVYADIYYPTGVAFHATSTYPDTPGESDYGELGCDEQRGRENVLHQLSKEDGYRLFCESVRDGNNNLPVFNDNYTGFSGLNTTGKYNEICDYDGELMEEEAYVYCAEKVLDWEDPAGDYRVVVMAQDKSTKSDRLENHFTYIPMTAFEPDFDSISYGNVKWNTEQGVSGDLDFDEAGGSLRPTVRNTGNTRLYMGVQQDDMGLEQLGDGTWNVKYKARVGNGINDWSSYYYPFAGPKYLQDILDLSQENKMDFSILVTKFPTDADTWIGDMTLSAKFAPFRTCITH